MNRFRLYALAIACAAGGLLAGLVATAPAHTPPLPAVFPGLVAFLLLGILSEALSLPLKGAKAVASISFLLHLASVPLFGPLWSSIQAALAELTVETWVRRRRDPFVVIFNTFQILLSVGIGGWCYWSIADASALTATPQSLLGFGALALTYFIINSVAVCIAASFRTGEPLYQVWREIGASTFVYDVVSAPFAWFIALLYTRAGLPAAVLILLFILYLRHVYQQRLKLQQLNRDLVHVLIKTIEHRDPYTSGHSLRVAHVSRAIGVKLRFSQRKLEQLEIAALFHDIGKIGAAYNSIITHPGSLSDDQKNLIRSHPARGAELLASMESIDESVILAVKHHHEFYNGRGYPDGLAGESIPIFARIIMLADSMDAMASLRPYRGPLSRELVVRELRTHAGHQFDPGLVRILLERGLVDTALELARRQAESPDVQRKAAPARRDKIGHEPAVRVQ